MAGLKLVGRFEPERVTSLPVAGTPWRIVALCEEKANVCADAADAPRRTPANEMLQLSIGLPKSFIGHFAIPPFRASTDATPQFAWYVLKNDDFSVYVFDALDPAAPSGASPTRKLRFYEIAQEFGVQSKDEKWLAPFPRDGWCAWYPPARKSLAWPGAGQPDCRYGRPLCRRNLPVVAFVAAIAGAGLGAW